MRDYEVVWDMGYGKKENPLASSPLLVFLISGCVNHWHLFIQLFFRILGQGIFKRDFFMVYVKGETK
jgi:hypothetical protein